MKGDCVTPMHPVSTHLEVMAVNVTLDLLEMELIIAQV